MLQGYVGVPLEIGTHPDQPEPIGLDTAFCQYNISVATFRMHCPRGDGVDNDGFFKGLVLARILARDWLFRVL